MAMPASHRQALPHIRDWSSSRDLQQLVDGAFLKANPNAPQNMRSAGYWQNAAGIKSLGSDRDFQQIYAKMQAYKQSANSKPSPRPATSGPKPVAARPAQQAKPPAQSAAKPAGKAPTRMAGDFRQAVPSIKGWNSTNDLQQLVNNSFVKAHPNAPQEMRSAAYWQRAAGITTVDSDKDISQIYAKMQAYRPGAAAKPAAARPGSAPAAGPRPGMTGSAGQALPHIKSWDSDRDLQQLVDGSFLKAHPNAPQEMRSADYWRRAAGIKTLDSRRDVDQIYAKMLEYGKTSRPGTGGGGSAPSTPARPFDPRDYEAGGGPGGGGGRPGSGGVGGGGQPGGGGGEFGDDEAGGGYLNSLVRGLGENSQQGAYDEFVASSQEVAPPPRPVATETTSSSSGEPWQRYADQWGYTAGTGSWRSTSGEDDWRLANSQSFKRRLGSLSTIEDDT